MRKVATICISKQVYLDFFVYVSVLLCKEHIKLKQSIKNIVLLFVFFVIDNVNALTMDNLS